MKAAAMCGPSLPNGLSPGQWSKNPQRLGEENQEILNTYLHQLRCEYANNVWETCFRPWFL